MNGSKEIGGYFGLEQLIAHEYYSNLIAVNNARCALLYILKAKHYKKVYLPYFLCDSVKLILERESIPFELYRIDRSFAPLLDKAAGADEVVYIVNYYGLISTEQLIALKERYRNIVVDNAQAFFAKPVDGIDTIYSCRKFFGVPDGGYASTDIKLQETIPVDISMGRMKHILGRYEGKCASDYYKDFCNNDESFKGIGLHLMSKLTHNILGAIDYQAVKHRREENFTVLSKALESINPIHPNCPDGPYAYPFYAKNGMSLKKELAGKKIYVATLWPNVLKTGLAAETDLAENILPLPCDQRYSEDDMHIIADTIKELLLQNQAH